MAIKDNGYDPELAEKSLASTEAIARGSISGLGLPSGNRSMRQRNSDNFQAEMELFRPIKNVPRQQKDVIEACMNAYHRIGLLRNVIDMMSSFGCQGIQIVHPDKNRERLYKAWFRKVRGPERSERFLNALYRAGNVIVKREMAKLSSADIKDLQRTSASLQTDVEYERGPKPGVNQVPIEYVFLNPTTIEVAGGDLATFLGHPVYQLKVPNFIITMIKTPKTPTEEQMIADLPKFIRDPIKKGQKFITLDNDKLSVFHYMKDDWQQWATPITYSILADLILYEKMKLADMSALEGAINHLRIIKLGNIEKGIQVSPAHMEKLSNLLASNPGGSIDLIWDAAIDLIETKTDVSQYLGNAKYEPILQSIFAGLGIPASLSGGGGGAGFTNNAISLKTLIERLQYGRDLLTEFWLKELAICQAAFGDDKPAQVIFGNMSLYDEASEKMLWFQLYDRQLVDDGTMQEQFGLIPNVVSSRINREEALRKSGKKPAKAGPYYDPQADHELRKISLQQGTTSLTEHGVEKKPKKPDDISYLDFQAGQADKDRKLQKTQQDAQIEMDKRQGDDIHKQKLQQNDDNHKLQLKHKDIEHKTMLPIKKNAFKKKTTTQLQNQKKGVPGQGRPKNSKDSGPRKTKTVKPSVKASMDMFALQQWAKDTYEEISIHETKNYLNQVGVKNVRSLSSVQAEALENYKLSVLCGIDSFSEYVPQDIVKAEQTTVNSLPEFRSVIEIYNTLLYDYIDREGNPPSIDKRRDMQISAYVIFRSEQNSGS